ncbi:hypothetical protein KSB_92550 [Ktedonobacter robiniae]|uniref:Uncharacterized protein n=1 Tax=Ktedonobacter robiniae TaxID=2778365 RepID=A0ABQ3V7F6_9CHLR|nr:hypothetical protein KSB_92550 [Ktedonobacter robiniae]
MIGTSAANQPQYPHSQELEELDVLVNPKTIVIDTLDLPSRRDNINISICPLQTF